MAVPSADNPKVMTIKQEIQRAIATLPDDAGFDDAFELLHVLYKIHVGTQQGASGESIPHEQVAERMAKWLR